MKCYINLDELDRVHGHFFNNPFKITCNEKGRLYWHTPPKKKLLASTIGDFKMKRSHIHKVRILLLLAKESSVVQARRESASCMQLKCNTIA